MNKVYSIEDAVALSFQAGLWAKWFGFDTCYVILLYLWGDTLHFHSLHSLSLVFSQKCI